MSASVAASVFSSVAVLAACVLATAGCASRAPGAADAAAAPVSAATPAAYGAASGLNGGAQSASPASSTAGSATGPTASATMPAASVDTPAAQAPAAHTAPGAVASPAAPAPSLLDAVAARGVLRVCMPGDYKPFGFRRPDGGYEGIDVELAGSLAASLGARAEFVPTTWARLMDDFAGGACDIGAGGISASLDRQRRAYFSAPYFVNGKVALARCADVRRFGSLAGIDRPGVRAVANPGGSNERWAKANLKHARLTMHPDNLGIFDEILAGRADVFVTEKAEALVQQHLRPGLCAVNPGAPLQYAEDALLLPRGDEAMKRYVDQWLHLLQASGQYRAIEKRWMP